MPQSLWTKVCPSCLQKVPIFRSSTPDDDDDGGEIGSGGAGFHVAVVVVLGVVVVAAGFHGLVVNLPPSSNPVVTWNIFVKHYITSISLVVSMVKSGTLVI